MLFALKSGEWESNFWTKVQSHPSTVTSIIISIENFHYHEHNFFFYPLVYRLCANVYSGQAAGDVREKDRRSRSTDDR